MSDSSSVPTSAPAQPATWQPNGVVLRRVPLENKGTIRLSTLLAATGDFARREVRRGKAKLGGVVTDLDTRIAPGLEPVELSFKGARYWIQFDDALVIAVNKPSGVVSTHEDENPRAAQLAGGTVFDLFPEWLSIEGLEPIGRLDKETSGLLLFTEHGVLSQRLRHPSRAVERRYIATLARPLEAAAISEALANGVELKDGTIVSPKKLEAADTEGLRYRVTITEGRYHEVRRLFAALGSHVEELHREGYGPVVLSEESQNAEVGEPTIDQLWETNERGEIVLRSAVTRLVGNARKALLDFAGVGEIGAFVQIVAEVDDSDESNFEANSEAEELEAEENVVEAPRVSRLIDPSKLRNFD